MKNKNSIFISNMRNFRPIYFIRKLGRAALSICFI